VVDETLPEVELAQQQQQMKVKQQQQMEVKQQQKEGQEGDTVPHLQEQQQQEQAVKKQVVARESRTKAATTTVGSKTAKGSPKNGVGVGRSDASRHHRGNGSRVRCGSTGSSNSSSSNSSPNGPGGDRSSSGSGRSSVDSGMGGRDAAQSLATGALNLRRIASPPPVMPPSACTTPSRSPRNGARDAFMSPAASPWRGAALGFHDARSRAAVQVSVENSSRVAER
ncbi:unnamed protein product, partial [Laminaria digitata]